MNESKTVIFCPRCDRKFKGKKDGELYGSIMDRLIQHVRIQHPDHDPEWFDTFPSHV